MKRWRLWAGVLAVFACGVVIGAAGGHMLANYRAVAQFQKIRESKGGFLGDMAMHRLKEMLDLTKDQAERIKPILQDVFQKGHDIHNEVRPKIDAVMQEGMASIRKLLTPEQQAKLGTGQYWKILLPGPPPLPPGDDGPPPHLGGDGPPPPGHGGPPPLGGDGPPPHLGGDGPPPAGREPATAR